MKKLSFFTLILISSFFYFSCTKKDETLINENKNTLSSQNIAEKNADVKKTDLTSLNQSQQQITSSEVLSSEANLFLDAPQYPYYPNSCKLIMKVEHGDCGIACLSYDIEILGHSGLGETGQLLFTLNSTISQEWTEYEIPQSAYLTFTLTNCSGVQGGGECLNILIGEFGYSRNSILRNFPTNTKRSVYNAVKYPPYNQYGDFTCAEWCTWEGYHSIGSNQSGFGGYNLYLRHTSGGAAIQYYQNNSQNSIVSKLYYPIAKSNQYYLHTEWNANTPAAPICTNLSNEGFVYLQGLPTIGVSPLLGAPRNGCGILHGYFGPQCNF